MLPQYRPAPWGPHEFDQPGVEPDADPRLREALARRDAWTEPRRQLPAPAQVQDPPARRPVASPRPAASADDPELIAQRARAAAPQNEDLIREALANRGRPYVWGGASRGGFDCSGFMLYLYKRMRGINLPHSASAQMRMGRHVERHELQPGDLVFFAGSRRAIGHVGMYIGDNKIIHAANHKRDVRIDTLTGYYDRRYRGARRLSPTPIRIPSDELRNLAPRMGDGSVPPEMDAD